VGGAILSGNPIVPMPECRFAGPSLGIAAEVFDDRGEPVTEKLGELVVTKPWPAMTWGFWGEPQRYLETYWSRWENVWLHGDRAIRHPDGTWELPGRSDDLIKVAGKRIGPVEYESLATEVEGVLAAAAVGIPHPVKGEVAAVVLLPAPGSTADPEELEDRVRSHITASLGKAMSPYAVVAVPDIPLTRSGKVHRRVVRGWMSGVDPGDLSNLENPESRQAIEAAAARLKLGASEEETP
jgi:acetyl-CoA synthetase